MRFIVDAMNHRVIRRNVEVSQAAVAKWVRLPIIGGDSVDLGEVGPDNAPVRHNDHRAGRVGRQNGFKRGQDTAVKPAPGLSAGPRQIVVGEVAHAAGDLRMLRRDTLDRQALQGTEVHLHQFRDGNWFDPDFGTDHPSRGKGSGEWAGEERVDRNVGGNVIRDAFCLAKTVCIQGHVGGAVQDAANVALRLSVPNQVKRCFTGRGVPEVGETGGM